MFVDTLKEFDKYIEYTQDPVQRELAESEKTGAEYAKVAKTPDGLTITNAGKKVNKKQSEYSAFLDNSGKTKLKASEIANFLYNVVGIGN